MLKTVMNMQSSSFSTQQLSIDMVICILLMVYQSIPWVPLQDNMSLDQDDLGRVHVVRVHWVCLGLKLTQLNEGCD